MKFVFSSLQIRDLRDRQHSRELREKPRARPIVYQDIPKHDRYPGLDRDTSKSALEIVPTAGRYRHSYAEPPRLGIAALDPYWSETLQLDFVNYKFTDERSCLLFFFSFSF